MHPTYREFIAGRVHAAILTARASALVNHNGLKGTLREIVVKDLLRPILPADVCIGTGQIVSSHGETSTQVDIVLYDRGILPPVIFDSETETGLVPIESVAYAIEVKSTFTAWELRQAHESATHLLTFTYFFGST